MAGLFWNASIKTGKHDVYRPPPPIPETGWRPPPELPNLRAARALSIDVETYDPFLLTQGPGWARGKSHLVGISVATDDGHRWYLPFGHEVEPQYNLNRDHVLAWARDMLGDPLQPKTGANLIYDVGSLRAEGVHVVGDLIDVEFIEALLDERALVALEALGQKYCGRGKESSLLYQWCAGAYGGAANGSQRANIYRASPRLVGPYAESDATLPTEIARKCYPLLEREGLRDVFALECALIPLLIDMRFAGVTVDLAASARLRDQLLAEAAEHAKHLRDLAGFDVQVNSASSVARALDAAGVTYTRGASGQPSFTKEWLERHASPIAREVSAIRHLDKMRATFVEGYILDASVGGKVHCSFHPLRADSGGARSGRFSSSDPNLQNIPVRDEKWGPLLRGLFIPDAGHKAWRKYDYSQIEYRFLIHFAKGAGSDEARAHFNAHPETDYHDWALDLVAPCAGWDVSTKELRKKWRKPLKNINFGLIFGMGEKALAADLGLTRAEATKLFAVYHAGVPFAKPTMSYYSQQASELGYVSTISGRRSRFDLWESSVYGEKSKPTELAEALRTHASIKRAHAYRALNRVLQGSAADMIKAAMLACYRAGVFDVTGVPRVTVHDELGFSDRGGCDAAFDEVKRIMESAIELLIPVRSDGDIGPDWGHCKAI